jgi:hypothetical protein
MGKRKAEADLSTNANTKRVRERRDSMTTWEAQVDKAKRADIANIDYHKKLLRKTDKWKNANKDDQKKMEEDVKEERIRIR